MNLHAIFNFGEIMKKWDWIQSYKKLLAEKMWKQKCK
jgi:hypothetical protein